MDGGVNLNKIYTVMVMTDLNYDEQTKFPEFGSSRLVGWYSDLKMVIRLYQEIVVI